MRETIEVTFPDNIPVEKLIFLIEENIKQNTKYTCKVEFIGFEDDENVYHISSEYGPEVFYFIGMNASGILEAFNKL